ncbi:TRAP transporter small permease [Ventrimonas sp. CLA-AP-H27]|uniref:TRAP transporter small permease n=1 Tax=Ventrimonas faecis TaxID=3133170 RepID=A0ABV1HNK8_9FIRM
MKNESLAKKLLNHFEVYAGAGIFIIMTILLFVQVVTRYCFGHAVTWAEEVATILFVWMVYLGVAAAVLSRKHLKIDAFVEMLPFKAKKTLLIISNVIFLAFSLYIIFPMMSLVNNYAAKSAASPILKIPKALSYVVMPLCFLLTAIRLVQEIIRLSKEKEKELGVSKPIIDIAALEKEAEELARQKKGGNK